MKAIACVTGASGFVGRHVVGALLEAGMHVRAGIHDRSFTAAWLQHPECEVVEMDICNPRSLVQAFRGADHVYHFAAAVTARESVETLKRINAEGTRNVWNAAAEAGVIKALYCSSTAVYGLLAQNGQPVTEEIPACAVEPYGRSKLLGERFALELGSAYGIETIVIRPTAIFGPNENTHFGSELRKASLSAILLGGKLKNKRFNFVHVQDVADAAVHLMQMRERTASVFNIVAEPAISYEDAFRAYLNVLDKAGGRRVRQRVLARLSMLIERIPALSGILQTWDSGRRVFHVWRPGFDMTFTSIRLRSSSYAFRWTNFEDVLLSCMNEQ